jgi:hypothetical protein
VIEAEEDIPRGAEVLDSYGLKCNSRLLLGYGFAEQNNAGNEYPLVVELPEDDPNFQAKTGLFGLRRAFRCMPDVANPHL